MKNRNKLPLSKQEEIAKRLKNLRFTAGYTQKDIAEKMKITEKTYRKWEVGIYNGKTNIKYYPAIEYDNLFTLAEIYHVSIDYLLCRSNCTSVDNHYISLKTGLSDKAIQVLQKMKNSSFGRRLLASLEILVLDVEKFSGDKYYKRFLELFSDFLLFSGDDNKIYSISKNGEIKEENPHYDKYGNKKFNKDCVTITSDRLKYIYIMEITDTLKCLKEEYDKNPKFLD